jgi:hypothetical protein
MKISLKAAALALPLLAGALGCNEYKYVNVPVSFDQGSFDDSDLGLIHTCKVTVTGADSTSFYLEKCPDRSMADPHDVGTFEYSTFADSGTLKFELRAWTGLNQTDQCQIGLGSTSVPVTGATTITAPMPLVVAKSGRGCATNVADAGM